MIRDPSILNTDNGPDQPPPGFDGMGGKYVYDAEQGERPIRFIESLCCHYQGKFAGQPFLLLAWEKNLIRHLFGTYSMATGLRRYRTAYAEIGKGSGKTALAAALGLYALCGDREPGAEVYAVATRTKQANICFDGGKQMATRSPRLKRALQVHKYAIAHLKSASKWEVMSGEDSGKHGIKPTFIIADELHEWTGRDLWDALESASVKRDNFMMLAITNAGWDRESVCYQLHEQAERFMRGETADETFFGLIYTAPADADWTDESTWHHANPSLGETVQVDAVRAECVKAKENPVLENRFRRLYLSQWVGNAEAWLSPDLLDQQPRDLDPAELVGRPCYLGIDLSSTDDLTAAVALFPPRNDEEKAVVLPSFFLPGDNLERLGRKHRMPYSTWHRRGLLKTTTGNVIDYDDIRRHIRELANTYRIMQVGLDRLFQGQALESDLLEDGLDVMPVGAGWRSQARPLAELERLIKAARLNYGGHPVMRWNLGNAVCKADDAGNLSLSKRLSRSKVDGVAALLCALFCWQADEANAGTYYTDGEAPELIVL
ncbi:MAG: terminase TerL endonuclease subunit [Planctomycetota bacterium]